MKHIQLFKEFITEKSTNGNIDPDELLVGQKVEMEHTSSRDEAMKIAKDHLSEDPHYYKKLRDAGLIDEPEAMKIAKKLENISEAKSNIPEYIISSTSASTLKSTALPKADVGIGLLLADELNNWTLRVSDYDLVHYNDKIALKLTSKGKLSVRVKTEKDANYLKILQSAVNNAVSKYINRISKI